MKKVLAVVFVLICLLGLVGCDPGMNSIDGDEILNNTVKIELVHYENASPKLIRIGGKNAPIFDFSKVTSIATLDDSRIEDVVKDIAKQELLLWGKILNEPIGKTLILYQNDGNMLVLFGCVYKNNLGSTRYYGDCRMYDENGIFVEYLGDIDSDYVDMLESKFFESDT